MTFSIKILESDPIIKGRIIRAIAQELNNVFARSKGNITREIKTLTEELISMSPEIQSLQGGELQGAFGIRQGEQEGAVNSIIEAIKESVIVETIPVAAARSTTGRIKGGIKIYIQPDNFLNLLSLPQGYTSYGTGGENSIPWLEWLLTLGDKILIGDYHFEAGDKGRSGLGTMLPPGVFRVPPSYSGTEDNNFITRAFEKKDKQIAAAINKGLR